MEITQTPQPRKGSSRMNTHKHAGLTYARRIELVLEMKIEGGLSAAQAVERGPTGVTPPTARKWLRRYLAAGEAALADASSTPACSPRSL